MADPRSSGGADPVSDTATVARVPFRPYGAALDFFHYQGREVLLSGPAGTGKSRAALEKVHLILSNVPRARALAVRKTLVSLTSTGVVTYKEKVLHPLDGVRYFGGSPQEPPAFIYPNGSRLMLGGMDKPSKVLSTEYDLIYYQEATESTVDDWETLITRLRNGRVAYQQLLADCNPDAPTHWLKQRCDMGSTKMFESVHQDNPVLWDEIRGTWTDFGADYIAGLDALTGVRKDRLRFGRWVAAEGMIYEDSWDRRLNLIDREQIPVGDQVLDACGVPVAWPRYWAVDFGFTNPFCWQAWAEDPDGRLYRYQEIYRTQRLVEDHARDILDATRGQPRPQAIICDHDAEDRATLERYLKQPTQAAWKDVSPGLQATASRFKRAGDGKPRLFYVRDALVHRDPKLVERSKPTCSEEEVEGYIWDPNKKKGEEPLKENDHGMDATRYMVAHRDVKHVHSGLTRLGTSNHPQVDAGWQAQRTGTRY